MGLCGYETTPAAERPLRALQAAIATALVGTHLPTRCAAVYFALFQGPELGPDRHITTKRDLVMRRRCANDHAIGCAVRELVTCYANDRYPGTVHDEVRLEDLEAAPPPSAPGCGAWKPAQAPRGPVALLLTSLHRVTTALDEQLYTHVASWPPVSLDAGPAQALRKALRRTIFIAHVGAASRHRAALGGSGTVDFA
eukprot:8649565-Alexandrium_andersonii.AAC.1